MNEWTRVRMSEHRKQDKLLKEADWEERVECIKKSKCGSSFENFFQGKNTFQEKKEAIKAKWVREREWKEAEWVAECYVGWVSEWVLCWLSEWVSEWVSAMLAEWVSATLAEWMSEWVSAMLGEWVSATLGEWARRWMNE